MVHQQIFPQMSFCSTVQKDFLFPGRRVDRAASRAGVQLGARDRGDERGAARGGQARHLRRGEAAGAAAARPPLRQIRRRKRESITRLSKFLVLGWVG